MKSRNLGLRLAALLSLCSLAACGAALTAAPAGAVPTNPSAEQPSFTCGCEASFTIEKRQEIAGSEKGFTTAPLTGAIGQTVDYQIVVENTGHTAQIFSEFADPHCDEGTIAGGPGNTPVGPGEATTYTCTRLLAAAGTYTNEATVTGNGFIGTPVTETSNQVVVEVPSNAPPPQPGFTIEKRQKIAGSSGGFTTSTLTGTLQQTVDYQITVHNSGNVALVLSGFTDIHCDKGTIAGGPGEAPIAAGGSTTYTCTHLLMSEGSYSNEATVTGTPAGGQPLTHTSNRVEVLVPAAPAPAAPASHAEPVVPHQGVKPCEASQPPFHGPTGPKSAVFTAQMSSHGIKQITFYLDGHKLRSFRQSQARAGRFTVKIDPRRLSHGRHIFSVKGTMTDPTCGSVAHASVFVRPFTASRPPKFTG